MGHLWVHLLRVLVHIISIPYWSLTPAPPSPKFVGIKYFQHFQQFKGQILSTVNQYAVDRGSGMGNYLPNRGHTHRK